MQPFDMGDQLRLTGPPAEVETEHLIGAFGRRVPDPQADQQTGDQGHIDLHPHAIGCLTQQVSAAQHTFDPPEKQLHGPPIAIAPGVTTSADALFHAASQLPRVELAAPASKSPIGKNTVSAVQAGLIYGYVALVEGMTARVKSAPARWWS